MKLTRDERMELFELIDCTVFTEHVKVAADVIDFECTLFERWVQHQDFEPFYATLGLITAFTAVAGLEANRGNREVVFPYRSLSRLKPPTMTNWKCKVIAYIDGGRRCLLFSDVADAV